MFKSWWTRPETRVLARYPNSKSGPSRLSDSFKSGRHRKVQVGKDQEKAQSEKDSNSKNQGGEKTNQQSGTYTMKTYRKPNEQLFSQ